MQKIFFGEIENFLEEEMGWEAVRETHPENQMATEK